MCPFGTYCVPVDGGQLGQEEMAGHCLQSFCGENVPNGVTGGTCKVGGENWVDETGLRDGWCNPFGDGNYGLCMEAGTVPEGGACDLVGQTRSGDNCVATAMCVGDSGAAHGTCARRCDPATIDADTATNTGCPPGEDCHDVSLFNAYWAGSRSTLGYCTDVIACQTIVANDCPPDAAGMQQGCQPTNPLRATGICTPEAYGTLPAGATCPAAPAGDTEECTPGTLCRSSCMTLCDIAGTPTIDCAAVAPSFQCNSAWWAAGTDGVNGTGDDIHTADWGLCGLP